MCWVEIDKTDQAEVGQDRLEVIRKGLAQDDVLRPGSQQDVARLDVAVDHAAVMGVLQGARHGIHEADDLREIELFIFFVQGVQILEKRWPLDVLHHQVGMAVHQVEIKDLDDVGVAQFADDHGLALEALKRMWVFVVVVPQHFNGNFALQGGMRANIDFRHSAPCQECVDADLAQCLADPSVHITDYTQSVTFVLMQSRDEFGISLQFPQGLCRSVSADKSLSMRWMLAM